LLPRDIDIAQFFGLLFATYKQFRSDLGSFWLFRRYVSYLFVFEHAYLWKGVTMTRLLRSSNFWLLSRALLVVISFMLAGASQAQTTQKRPVVAPEDDPVFHDYRGVKIGWLADEVRKKLGSPANKGDEQDFYIFGEKETAQVLYDKGQVTAISVDFMNGAKEVITPQQVFGADIDAKPDGSKYKLVRYPKAGYWVSYSRTAGETPIVTVTIQKLPPQ
jgi:hypothetical protein